MTDCVDEAYSNAFKMQLKFKKRGQKMALYVFLSYNNFIS